MVAVVVLVSAAGQFFPVRMVAALRVATETSGDGPGGNPVDLKNTTRRTSTSTCSSHCQKSHPQPCFGCRHNQASLPDKSTAHEVFLFL